MKPVKPMKHLMRYEGYTSMERVDDILDKISKYGIKSLTQLEKEFLDSVRRTQSFSIEQNHWFSYAKTIDFSKISDQDILATVNW